MTFFPTGVGRDEVKDDEYWQGEYYRTLHSLDEALHREGKMRGAINADLRMLRNLHSLVSDLLLKKKLNMLTGTDTQKLLDIADDHLDRVIESLTKAAKR